jgi:nitric oxide dioxygenase
VHPLMAGGSVPPGTVVDEQLIKSLQTSFAAMVREDDALAVAFYDRLFSLHPELREMFPKDMKAQRIKLTDSLKSVIEGLRSPEIMKGKLRELGARHVRYGARPQHYPIVCACLLEAMRRTSPAWSPAIEADWTRALRLISENMQASGGTGATRPA